MAYKLDIAFGNHKEIMVLNDIKVDFNGHTAQIDHLVLTCYSAYFIETKNSWGNISINEYRDWARYFGNKRYNMDSPIRQSEDHQKILFDFLKTNLENFMGKALPGIYKKLGTYTAHHYVAVGKDATITGKGRELVKDQLLKYDQITNKILEHYKTSSKTYLFADLKDNDKFKTLNLKELKKMAEFILSNDISESDPLKAFNIEIEQNESYQNKDKNNSYVEVSEEPEDYSIHVPSGNCPDCNSKTSIAYGKYGYYWKCSNCSYTEGIKVICPNCKNKMKLRKRKNEYLIQCDNCNIEGVYFEVE